MVEAQKYRIEQEMTNLVNELDRSYLRKMQQSLASEHMVHLMLSDPVAHGHTQHPKSCVCITSLGNWIKQGDMHRCAAKCCDDTQVSLERVHGCIDNCTAPLNQANNYVQNEINHFQNRLQRCVMDCNDSARDRLGPNPSQETVDKCTTEFERCAVKCVDKHMALIPSMLKTMKSVLASGKPPPGDN